MLIDSLFGQTDPPNNTLQTDPNLGFVNKGRGGRGAGVRSRSGPVQALTPAIETEKVVLTLINQSVNRAFHVPLHEERVGSSRVPTRIA